MERISLIIAWRLVAVLPCSTNKSKDGRIYIGCAFLLILFVSIFPPGPAFSEDSRPYSTDIGQFNYAKFMMEERDYRVAAREFARLIEDFPASPLKPEAQFNLAEAYMLSGRYREAEAEFRLFISNFNDSPYAPAAEVRIEDARESLKGPKPAPAPLRETIRPTYPSMRAVQVMFFEGKTFVEVDKELKRLREAGIDTVIARVFHNKGDRFYPLATPKNNSGVYFSTTHAPVVDNILPEMTRLAHKNGLKIFAWMTTRYADYGIEDREDLACRSYDISAREGARCKGLDLFNESAVKRLEAIYSDMAANDIDGVLFQDDLVSRHNEGFGTRAVSEFSKDTGSYIEPEALYLRIEGKSAVHYTQLFWEWSSWKNRRLLFVADRLRDAVRKKRPEARFAINLMYESVTNPPYALAWLSQNLEAAMKMRFDYYSIMAYHRQMEEELNKDPGTVRGMIEGMVNAASKTVGEPEKVLIKIQTIDWRTGRPLSNDEVVGLIKDIKGIGNVSLAVVPYRADFPFPELGGSKGIALLN